MNQLQLIGLLRRYTKTMWDFQRRYVAHGSAYMQWKAEYDGAMKALMLLEAAAYEQQKQGQQPTMIGDNTP